MKTQGERYPPAKEPPRLPGAKRSDSLSRPSEIASPADNKNACLSIQSLALILDIQPPYSETINFCGLSHQFVVLGLGKP